MIESPFNHDLFVKLEKLFKEHGFAGELQMKEGRMGRITWFGDPTGEMWRITITIVPAAEADQIELSLPCDVRLPTGVTLGKGVSLSSFLAAAKRQADQKFQDPPPEATKLKRIQGRAFIRRMLETSKQSVVEAQMIWRALERSDFDIVLREAMQKLPHEVQLDMAQTLLMNLGMVAVRSEHVYAGQDGEQRPWIEALFSYATSLGFCLIPSERMADIEAAVIAAAEKANV